MLQHLQAFEHEECTKEHAFELERLRLNVQLLEAQLKQKQEQQNFLPKVTSQAPVVTLMSLEIGPKIF